MKTLQVLFLLFFAFNTFSQTGAVQLECLAHDFKKPVSNLLVEIHTDSLCFEQHSDEKGIVLFRGLPLGNVTVWFVSSDNEFIRTASVFIQENQVLQNTFAFDSLFSVKEIHFGSNFEIGNEGTINRKVDIPNFRSGVLEIQEMTCISSVTVMRSSYQSSQGSLNYITREDIANMPVRTVDGVASTVGGVQTDYDGNISIRGGRTDGNAYYIDGMRVRNANIPKSAINNVNVITGGIPANYGDLTGGIIAVETKDINMREVPQYYSSPRTNSTPSTTVRTIAEEEPQLNYDLFLPIYENDFLSSSQHPNSTFGLDVDQASWTYLKQRLNNRQTVQRDAIKLEEMINSFHYVDVQVAQNELFGVRIQRIPCLWNHENELIAIHMKAMDLPKDLPRKKHNLVLLVDVSGSMSSSNKLPLLIAGLKEFVSSLDESDNVSIVTYAGTSGVALEPTSCDKKNTIYEALDGLVSGGSTNGIGGITEAYRLAEKNYDPEKNNRIILATDGDFNVGINTTGDLEAFIAEKRGRGIYLTALGFGMGNYQNSILETLADKGDGNHFYINDLAECKKVLVDNIGNIMNIARDVKLNVEFNPDYISEYRLIGYENRLLKPKDFEDDTKDAGEIGYGHEVTAVYEVKKGKAELSKDHFVKTKENIGNNNELAFVKLRYKAFEDSTSVERRFSLLKSAEMEENVLLQTVISFGLELRNSVFKGSVNETMIKDLAKKVVVRREEEEELKSLILSINFQ